MQGAVTTNPQDHANIRILRSGSEAQRRWSPETILDSQVAGNYGPLDPKVDHYWFKVAHNYESLALQDVFFAGSSCLRGLLGPG